MKAKWIRHAIVVPLIVLTSQLSAPTAGASHAWGTYHWARAANPFTLQLGRNLSGTWPSYLATTSSDWSASAVLDTAVVTGGTNARRCTATAGRVEVCNSLYGQTGWVGLASVWSSADSHITQATVKLNDTYFSTAKYNTPAWRNLVMCQEVGHTFGLDHQDVAYDNPNLNTCMDYTNDPSSNQHPNAHDYDELALIYGHVDSSTTVAAASASSANAGAAADLNRQDTWGRAVRYSQTGRAIAFERDLGGGEKEFTFVIWAE
jgi:hypothetical protein